MGEPTLTHSITGEPPVLLSNATGEPPVLLSFPTGEPPVLLFTCCFKEFSLSKLIDRLHKTIDIHLPITILNGIGHFTSI
jgi:hypothetical protein